MTRNGRGRIPADGLGAGYHVSSTLGLHKANDMAKLQPVVHSWPRASCKCTVCRAAEVADAPIASPCRRGGCILCARASGRCVVEGRLSGARVLATDIAEFAELRDGDVYLYKDPAGFFTGVDRLTEMTMTRYGLHRLSISRPFAACDREAMRTKASPSGAKAIAASHISPAKHSAQKTAAEPKSLTWRISACYSRVT